MAQLKMQDMHGLSLSINVTPEANQAQYAPVGAGIDNLQEQLNEVVQQYRFLADQGFARSRVTAMAPVWTMSGRRVHGDAAQDFIFGRKYLLGASRETDAKLVYTANGKTVTIAFDCTITNIQELSGSAQDVSAISCELHVNGSPTRTVA